MALILRSEWVTPDGGHHEDKVEVLLDAIRAAPVGASWSAPKPPQGAKEGSYAEAVLTHRDEAHVCLEIRAWVKKAGAAYGLAEKRTLFIPLVDLF